MASDKRLVKKYGKIADQIIALEPQMRKLKDSDFKKKTKQYQDMFKKNPDMDVEDILVEAYAVAREAARRVLGLNAYRVQLIGAIVLNSGDIAQMRTGEGKTLTGLFAAYLNALTGKGVHIVTVNEYLSARDAEINGKVFDLLGLTVGVNSSQISKWEKREAYAKDITYTTNSELGFDYLRDNMVMSKDEKVQRGLNYVIIDEADSVLIDEARTPLIISGGSSSSSDRYVAADKFAKTLDPKKDIDIDLETKQVFLTDSGMEKADKYFSVHDMFSVENTELFHLILNALKANFTFKVGVEYDVQDGEIVLIDQFTGRIMEGRSYSDGLQQALQAKEEVDIEEESETLATITYQNFYRLYAKISGMTGTAKTEEEEFIKIYNTRVVVIPTNKPVIRKDEPDLTFGTKNAALKYLVKDVKEVHEHGNPVLIGTTSVESSEQIARYLDNADLDYEMINAKNHGREAEIVAKAGQKGAITLATNMAGRGTDIKLSDEVKQLGGLYVFGVERNEARRVDDQLRGRSGRQGDPGLSRFYISMEDDLMIRFTSPKMRQNFLKLGDDYIKSRMFTRSVSNAQKKLEGMNFDQRKNVLDYDNIIAQQREAMYSQRDEILTTDHIENIIKRMFYTSAYEIVLAAGEHIQGETTIDTKKLVKAIDGIYVPKGEFKPKDFESLENSEAASKIVDGMMKFLHAKTEGIDPETVDDMERSIVLETFDYYWTKHINIAGKLKSGIYLQQYAQNNPLAEYVEQATKLFNKMKIDIANDVTTKLSQVVLRSVETDKKPEPITITDKDIDEIFAETGLSKKDLDHETLKKKFDKMIADTDPSDKAKIEKLKKQNDILQGLVYEIEKYKAQQANQPQKEINLTNDDVKDIFKLFGLKDDKFTKEEVQTKYEELIKSADTDVKKLQIEVGKQVLFSIWDDIHNPAKKPTESAHRTIGKAKIG